MERRVEGGVRERSVSSSPSSSCGGVDGNGGGGDSIVEDLIGAIEKAGSYGGYRKTQKKECVNLARRLKLLVPLLEEIGEARRAADVPGDALDATLAHLRQAVVAANKLLKQCHCGSKIYLALENEAVMSRFHAAYDQLNEALDEMPYDELGVSVEVQEQVELMRMQLKRAQKRRDTQDMELAMDLMVVLSEKDDRNVDNAILQRLANRLELRTFSDLKSETAALRKLVKRFGKDAHNVRQMTGLFGKFKRIAGFDEPNAPDCSFPLRTLEKSPSFSVPHEFLCPIALEIMTDPVIVATGQTYERESIQKWLDSNHRTCPKTGQILDHLLVVPNYALRNFILHWCEKNGFELPRKAISVGFGGSSIELTKQISCLVQDLSSSQPNEQRDAILKLRALSKENPDNRILIANLGGITPLVQLLSFPDSKIQEHTVTALLNLSLNEANKRVIAREGAIPAIIDVLQNGTDEARENSAAALFSISMLDENKVLVGSANGIPPLVDLLKNGTVRGKKDAATALFNLSLHKANKSRAIKAGVILPLLDLLEDKDLGMVDEALSILLLLASHPEGRSEMGRLSFIKTLVEIIKNGTPKNKECATSVLLELGLQNSSFVLASLQYGVYEHLVEITRNGTNRAQRKANSLLQHMSKCKHIP
ncbi:U-box domain-containing protein 15-like [Rhodamnia argentea]|uniref:RING-type E3 ubiquitin transferase n=1 Tax=Rhodamnia argentea TaxID=178133 RepID=A0A8B8NK00_9MYRT|nr:U-box domain-containing protein 15-like [Rhodamnia argentea]